MKRKMVALTADQIDCIIAYIVPLDLWYVLPVEVFSPCKNLWFYPNGSKKGSRFESFREAWWLLDPELKEATTEQAPAPDRVGTAPDPSRPSTARQASGVQSFHAKTQPSFARPDRVGDPVPHNQRWPKTKSPAFRRGFFEIGSYWTLSVTSSIARCRPVSSP